MSRTVTLSFALAISLAPLATQAQQTSSATWQTPRGELQVTTGQAPPRDFGPAPSFEQLAGSSGRIGEAQAAAYPPLANDFIFADGNRNGSISRAEYARWLARN